MRQEHRYFTLLTILFLFSSQLLAQSCPECRFSSYVFDSVQVSTVQFGEGVNADGQNQPLYLDVYEPVGDTMQNRPVVFFAFGGAFVQGSRDANYVVRACERFARAGYVAISPDYRIGFDPLGLFPVPTEELMRVFFRAMQDMRGAVQWSRAHADQMGNTYRLDTNKIMIGGASAGGITACMVAYCDKETEYAEIGNLSAIAGLGGFNSTSSFFPNYSWDANAVFNVSGAIVNTEWIEAGDPPIFSAHGDQDIVVPYMGGNFGIGPISIGLEGSFNIHEACQTIGVCSELYTMVGQGHPDGGESEEFLDEIFNRSLPLAWGVVNGYDFCCPLEADVVEEQIEIVAGNSVELNVNVNNGTNPTIRICDAYCAATGTGTPYSYVPDSFTTYAVAIVTDGNCMDTDFATITELPVSQPEAVLASHLDLFPTPVRDRLWLTWEKGERPPEMIRLFDMKGRFLQQWSWKNGTKKTIDLLDYDAGIYFLEVERQGALFREKVLLAP